MGCKICLFQWIAIVTHYKTRLAKFDRFHRSTIMAYITRAVKKPSGFYRSLNSQSTADLLATLSATPVDVYEVERLVASRRKKVSSSTPHPQQCAIHKSFAYRAGLNI